MADRQAQIAQAPGGPWRGPWPRSVLRILRSSSSARVASHAHPSRTALAMASLGWPDADLPMASGSSLLGEMPYSPFSALVVSSPTLHWLSCWMVPRETREVQEKEMNIQEMTPFDLRKKVVTQKSQWTSCCKPERSEVTTRSIDPKTRS